MTSGVMNSIIMMKEVDGAPSKHRRYIKGVRGQIIKINKGTAAAARHQDHTLQFSSLSNRMFLAARSLWMKFLLER